MKRSLNKNGASVGLKRPIFANAAQNMKMKLSKSDGGSAAPSNHASHSKAASQKSGNGSGPLIKASGKIQFRLEPELLLRTHDMMVKARVLEERIIRMYKQNNGYFWIGGPGEEAFQIPLGMQVKKGQGVEYDFLHLHYRASGILLAMGAEPISFMRQMKNTASDPYSGGRNFSNHASIRKWNVVPITSTIETQYATAIGTGIAQKREGGDSITIVTGGDAGTAEGEYASCLIWSSRPGNELPMLIVVTNNHWGISTPEATQHGDKIIADRAKAFGIKSARINGNDVEESTLMLREAMDYIRTERKPFMLEATCSRLYGHSSATGCNFIADEEDCLATFEKKLESGGLLSRPEMEQIREKYNQEYLDLSKEVIQEAMPDPSTIYDHVYYGQKGKYW